MYFNKDMAGWEGIRHVDMDWDSWNALQFDVHGVQAVWPVSISPSSVPFSLDHLDSICIPSTEYTHEQKAWADTCGVPYS